MYEEELYLKEILFSKFENKWIKPIEIIFVGQQIKKQAEFNGFCEKKNRNKLESALFLPYLCCKYPFALMV